MGMSLCTRAGPASVAAIIVLASLAPALAGGMRGGPAPARGGFLAPHHGGFLAARGRVGRYAASDWRGGRASAWRNRAGWSRWGRNSWYWGQAGLLSWGGSYWPDTYGYSGPAVAQSGEASPVLVSAPSVAIYAGAASDPPGAGGACVIHKLLYDRAGKYIGERRFAEC